MAIRLQSSCALCCGNGTWHCLCWHSFAGGNTSDSTCDTVKCQEICNALYGWMWAVVQKPPRVPDCFQLSDSLTCSDCLMFVYDLHFSFSKDLDHTGRPTICFSRWCQILLTLSGASTTKPMNLSPLLIRPIPTLVALVKIRRQGAILVKDWVVKIVANRPKKTQQKVTWIHLNPEAMGLLYMQTSPGKTERVKEFRDKLQKVIGDKHEDVLIQVSKYKWVIVPDGYVTLETVPFAQPGHDTFWSYSRAWHHGCWQPEKSFRDDLSLHRCTFFHSPDVHFHVCSIYFQVYLALRLADAIRVHHFSRSLGFTPQVVRVIVGDMWSFKA